MAFLDFLTGKINCPRCGAGGAKEEGGRILCPNPTCPYYAGTALGSAPQGAGSSSTPRSAQAPSGGSSSGRTVAIRYRNFKGEEKEFLADADSARRMAKRVSVSVAPKGVRISLAYDRISNWSQLDGVLSHRVEPGQAPPSQRERQVLAYHKKYKTTSPLYEQIRAKYPNW